MSSSENSKLERLLTRIKSNPIVATLIVLSTLIVTLASVTNATKNLLSLLPESHSVDINGTWQASVHYDWANAVYDEKFVFDNKHGELTGTASFLKTPRSLAGQLQTNQLSFVTKTQEMPSGEVTRHYLGKINGDTIDFVMRTEGGSSVHVPIQFTAQRAGNKPL